MNVRKLSCVPSALSTTKIVPLGYQWEAFVLLNQISKWNIKLRMREALPLTEKSSKKGLYSCASIQQAHPLLERSTGIHYENQWGLAIAKLLSNPYGAETCLVRVSRPEAHVARLCLHYASESSDEVIRCSSNGVPYEEIPMRSSGLARKTRGILHTNSYSVECSALNFVFVVSHYEVFTPLSVICWLTINILPNGKERQLKIAWGKCFHSGHRQSAAYENPPASQV